MNHLNKTKLNRVDVIVNLLNDVFINYNSKEQIYFSLHLVNIMVN